MTDIEIPATNQQLDVDWRSPTNIKIPPFPAMANVFHTDYWLVLVLPGTSRYFVFHKTISEMGGGPVSVNFKFCFDPAERHFGFEARLPAEAVYRATI